MSFLRHGEIYRPMGSPPTPGRPVLDRPGLIGTMSFRLAIPGGLPSGSARSASPATRRMRYSGPAGRGFFNERSTVSYSIVSGQGSTPVCWHRP